jgi:hypothetical protein
MLIKGMEYSGIKTSHNTLTIYYKEVILSDVRPNEKEFTLYDLHNSYQHVIFENRLDY